MNSTFLLNKNNDFEIGQDGNLRIVSGQSAIQQLAKDYLEIYKNELYFQQAEGLPYFENIFNGSPNVYLFEKALRSRILSIPGVNRIETLEIKRKETNLNTLEFYLILQTDSGLVTVNT